MPALAVLFLVVVLLDLAGAGDAADDAAGEHRERHRRARTAAMTCATIFGPEAMSTADGRG